MPASTLQIRIELDRIHCFDEDDGLGNAEPYLWTLFFKIDGSTMQVSDGYTLIGEPVILRTNGEHDNLSSSDVDAGEDVQIPEDVGVWETTLAPIPYPDWIADIAGKSSTGGVIGVVCVLMEEDNVSDDGARAGYNALVAEITTAIKNEINKISMMNQDISVDAFDQYKDDIESAITNAITSQQSFFENLWAGIDKDNKIGQEIFMWKHDDLEANGVGTTPFSKRWKKEGDWELHGSITVSMTCPARSAALATAKMSNASFALPEKEMQGFQRKEFKRYPGLKQWWDIARRHSSLITYGIMTDREVRDASKSLLGATKDLIANLDAAVPDKYLKDIETVLRWLSTRKSRKARLDASRALDMLHYVKGKKFKEAIELLNAVRPARHPKPGRNIRIKIVKPKRNPS